MVLTLPLKHLTQGLLFTRKLLLSSRTCHLPGKLGQMRRCVMGSEHPVFLHLMLWLASSFPIKLEYVFPLIPAVTLNPCRMSLIAPGRWRQMFSVSVNADTHIPSSTENQSIHTPHGGKGSDVGAGAPLGSRKETVRCQQVSMTTLSFKHFIVPLRFHFSTVQPGLASAPSACPNATSHGSSVSIHLCC